MDAHLLGWIASAVFLARLLPQPIQLARTGIPDGVSPLAMLNAAVADVAWAVYGLRAGLAPVWVVAVAAFVPTTWTAVMLRRQTTRRDVALAGLWASAIVLAAFAGGLGVVLAASVLVCQGPQVVRALRDDDLSGIAPATWFIAVADASLWGAYGLIAGDAALVGYAVVLMVCAGVILGRIAWTRRVVRTVVPALPGPA